MHPNNILHQWYTLHLNFNASTFLQIWPSHWKWRIQRLFDKIYDSQAFTNSNSGIKNIFCLFSTTSIAWLQTLRWKYGSWRIFSLVGSFYVWFIMAISPDVRRGGSETTNPLLGFPIIHIGAKGLFFFYKFSKQMFEVLICSTRRGVKTLQELLMLSSVTPDCHDFRDLANLGNARK